MIARARDRVAGELLLASLRAGHPIRLRVQGTSMLPALWPGDVLTIAPPPAAALAPGAIVLTCRAGRWTTHRVVARRGAADAIELVTRGDALRACDPAVPPSAIRGVVVARNGRPLAASAPWRLRGFLTARLVRSRALLALTLQLRALGRRLAPVAS